MGTISGDLNEIHYFAQVAKAQSFTTAAELLGMPKSSLSRGIRRLEKRLGVRLLERTTRSVSLTEAGNLYLEHCQRVLDEAEQAELAISALFAKPRGKLRVGAPIMFIRAILAPVLGEFLNAYPDLRVQLDFAGAESALRDKAVDVLICPGPLEDSGLLIKPIMSIRLGIYASPSYLKGRELPASPSEMRSLRLRYITATCSRGETTMWRVRRGSEVAEITVDPHVSVPDPLIISQLTLSGAGISMLSQSLARPHVAKGELIRLLPDWEPDAVELHALYPSRLNASPRVRAFLQFLRNHCAA
jgi:LysR family transcriptional regulator, transcriptional activator for dmlA